MGMMPAINYNTREWEVVEAWAREELEDTYKRLANHNTTPDQTQQLRGRASLLQAMLGWKEDSAGPMARTLT